MNASSSSPAGTLKNRVAPFPQLEEIFYDRSHVRFMPYWPFVIPFSPTPRPHLPTLLLPHPSQHLLDIPLVVSHLLLIKIQHCPISDRT